MGRSTAEGLSTSYRDAHKAAKPGDRSAVNERFSLEIENLKSQLGAELTSRQQSLVDLADDVSAKRRIRQEIAEIDLEINDIADLQGLIKKRGPDDDRSRAHAEASKLVAERRQINKEAADLDGEYTASARAIRKILERIRALRIKSDSHNRRCETLQDGGCETAGAGIGVVALVKGHGFLDELVQLPSLERGPAHWGKVVTEDNRPPRPMVPNPIDEYSGAITVANPDGSRRIISPAQGSPEDRRRMSEIERQKTEREGLLAAAREWDEHYAGAGGK